MYVYGVKYALKDSPLNKKEWVQSVTLKIPNPIHISLNTNSQVVGNRARRPKFPISAFPSDRVSSSERMS